MNMKAIVLLLFLAFFLFTCQTNNDSNLLLTESLPEQMADYQKTIIGHLSGEFELANNTKIKSRWSPEERAIGRQYLRELLRQINIEPQNHNYRAPNLNPAIDLILEPFKGTNIYGILPATNDSKEFIVLGAHYDTGKKNAPGAIDNATGVTLIYSVVKELSKSQSRAINVIVVFFDQEEEELIGSSAFVNHIQNKKWDIHSIHCFDMVGWDADKDNKMHIYSPSESLRNTYKVMAQKHNILIKENKIDPIGYNVSSTDFDVFVPKGYNVIGGGDVDYSPYKDSPDDTYETVNFNYLLSCTKLVRDIIKNFVVI